MKLREHLTFYPNLKSMQYALGLLPNIQLSECRGHHNTHPEKGRWRNNFDNWLSTHSLASRLYSSHEPCYPNNLLWNLSILQNGQIEMIIWICLENTFKTIALYWLCRQSQIMLPWVFFFTWSCIQFLPQQENCSSGTSPWNESYFSTWG